MENENIDRDGVGKAESCFRIGSTVSTANSSFAVSQSISCIPSSSMHRNCYQIRLFVNNQRPIAQIHRQLLSSPKFPLYLLYINHISTTVLSSMGPLLMLCVSHCLSLIKACPIRLCAWCLLLLLISHLRTLMREVLALGYLGGW